MQTKRDGLLSWLVWASACAAAAEDANTSNVEATWLPLDAHQAYAGKTASEWAEAWSKWSMSQTTCDSAVTDRDGSLCGLYQAPESEVFFLAFAPSMTERDQCVVPHGKALLVPLAPYVVENVGEKVPKSETELLEDARTTVASMRDVTLQADGVDISISEDRLIQPLVFSVKIPPAPNYYSCRGVRGIADTRLEPVVAAGYFAIMPPPNPGVHTLKHAAVATVVGRHQAISAATRLHVEAP